MSRPFKGIIHRGPASVYSSLALRFRSDSGVELASQNAVVGTPQNNVVGWTDEISGVRISNDQSLSPSFFPNIRNGRPGIIFQSSQYLKSRGIIKRLEGLSGGTIFLVSAGVPAYPVSLNDMCGVYYQIVDNIVTLAFGLDAPVGTNRGLVKNTANAFGTMVTLGSQTSIRSLLFEGAIAKTNASRFKIYNMGKAKTITFTGTVPASLFTTRPNQIVELAVGAFSNAGSYTALNGTVFDILIFDRALSDTEHAYVLNDLKYEWGFKAQRRVICDGNSLTRGAFITADQNYPKQMSDLLGQTWMVNNIGIDGQSTTQMIAKAADQIDTEIGAFQSPEVVVCWEGSNDLKNGLSTTSTYNNIVSYCNSRKSAGFKVVVCTILPGAITPNFTDANRLTVNSSIVANWNTFADALADIGGDATIGQTGQNTNHTYYHTDDIHLINAGAAIAAGIVMNALLTL